MQKFEGCPGSRMFEFKERDENDTQEATGKIESQLRQWPIQLHLISPLAPYYQGADVLLTADCVAYALGDFHRQYMQGKSIAIACPKLDEGQDQHPNRADHAGPLLHGIDKLGSAGIPGF